MSTMVMGLCWPLQMPPTPKAVLISIADQANDHGVCWPSLPGICERTCFKRTAVIEALAWLEQAGFISIERIDGRNNRYTCNLTRLRQRDLSQQQEPVREANQSARRTGTADGLPSPADGPPPVRQTDQPVRQTDPNRNEPSSEPSTTVSARGRAKPKGEDQPLTVNDLVGAGVERQAAADWLRVRRAPLTRTALAGVEREAAMAGISLGRAVLVAAENSWRGFKAAWYANLQQQRVGRDSPPSGTAFQRARQQQVAEMTGGLLDTRRGGDVVDMPGVTS